MLRYCGNIKYKEDEADLNFVIGTLLGAVKFKYNFKDTSGINGIYLFGIKLKKKISDRHENSSTQQNNQSTNTESEISYSEKEENRENFFDKAKDLISFIKKIIDDGSLEGCKDLFLDVIPKLIRHVFPKKLTGYLRYGFEDPSYTGKVLALLATMYPVALRKFQVTPEWNLSIIETDAEFKGRIHIIYVLYLAARVWFNKDFQILRRNINGRNSK